MDIKTTQLMGGTYVAAGDTSALGALVPAFRIRTRHGAGASLVDLAPDSVSWRPPVI
ncbi:hypothetical protein GCM10009718_06440 [Isoptericola halotolerans]|uniref:Uncharacterized protein n=1 Tax=Isoptericola halotolerans TaxID=300560 RepID=A0ABX2A0Q1_9MICO|nr:hypothetical protein [Isoptericola halotolerans]NOV96434.1 hypothetical protein [Isoptericola halotolerans]